MRHNPCVSVILTTHDRRHLLPMALSCYARQTYPHRELIVVDDSLIPIDDSLVAAVGGRVLRMEPGTPLGTKLNRGIADARGILCQKMDDDDWYSPHFLARMIEACETLHDGSCEPFIAFLVSFQFFDVVRWEIRQNTENEMSGATLLFARQDAEDYPFREIPRAVDVWFLRDHRMLGLGVLPVPAQDSFLQVRHRGHLWTAQGDGTSLDAHISRCPVVTAGPESLLSGADLEFYSQLRQQIASRNAADVP